MDGELTLITLVGGMVSGLDIITTATTPTPTIMVAEFPVTKLTVRQAVEPSANITRIT